MSRLARLWQWFEVNTSLPYFAGGNDADRDGIPDRADTNDGNGVDCSGAVWASYAYAWAPDPPPFPLSSTSGYALMARARGLFVPIGDRRPGDILLHSSNGDVFHSDGPVGHTEIDTTQTDRSGRWLCAGSSGSGNGVSVVGRPASFWQARLRIPGLDAIDGTSQQVTTPIITAADLRALVTAFAQSEEDDDMQPARINYPMSTQLNTFAVGKDGDLRQLFVGEDGRIHTFNVSADLRGQGLGVGRFSQEKPSPAIAPDGTLLVGVYGEDGTYNELRYKVGFAHWAQTVLSG